MNESYKDLKAYLFNEIAEDAHGVLNAIEGKEADLPPFRRAVAMLAGSWNSR